MAAAATRAREGGGRGSKYPPLASVAVLMLLVLAILPSALNLPQSNPTQTLEYAPVPPDKNDNSAPNTGNLASLGLAGTSSLAGSSVGPGGGSPDLPAAAAPGGSGHRPGATKRCVGNPPLQTGDPMAPPCVGYFDGDNFGETYQGVTKDEVRVIIVVTGYSTCGNYKGCGETRPERAYYDLAEPPKDDDPSDLRYVRAWQRYFNERYQTYDRFVHFIAYYPGQSTPEDRRADAIDNYTKVKPFAVVWPLSVPNIDAYNRVVASRGVLTFVGSFGLRADVFRSYPKLNWGFLPSLEEYARTFTGFVCRKVASNPVSFSGDASYLGQKRKYGLIYSGSDTQPEAKDFVSLVEPEIKKCGVEFAARATHPYSDVTFDTRTSGDYAAQAMADFQQKGITTIIWMLGYETNFSKDAAAINYRPEWIVAGDSFAEGLWGGQYQEQTEWDHAVILTLDARTKFQGVSQPCEDAYVEVDPTLPHETLDFGQACFFFDGLRQLFTGIQVAGPRLGPTTMDRGYHAIPAVPSKDPTVPACFYATDDYTCVKDATLFWYDSTYTDENAGNTQGCWRLMNGGKRYLAADWPTNNVNEDERPTDPCNGFLGGLQLATN